MLRPSSLIARFKNGSRSAFGALFQAYFPVHVNATKLGLSRYAAGPDDAEDIVLGAFQSLWRDVSLRRRLYGGLTGRASLLRILRLLIAQQLRRAQRDAVRLKRDSSREVRATDLPPATWNGLPDGSPGPEWRATYREILARLLDELPPQVRAIVEQQLAGQSKKETARIVGCSKRTVERQMEAVLARWSAKSLLRDE